MYFTISGLPIPFIAERLEDCEEEFPDLLEFTGNVIDKLNPPHPHVFCVQGFQVGIVGWQLLNFNF
jgi:hypothetical protein